MSDLLAKEETKPSLATITKTLVYKNKQASLATELEPHQPYVSVIETAVTDSDEIITLISDLAVHTKNLNQNPNCALMFRAPSERPLANSRATLVGEMHKIDTDQSIIDRYIEAHPSSEMTLNLAGFHFYRFTLKHAHCIANFGYMGRVDVASYSDARCML